MSYFIWLEATYGRVTGDWSRFNAAWATAEKYIIPTATDQPSNSSYNPSSPATYAPEFPDVSSYPSPLDSSVTSGQDPIASELQSAYGTPNIYGMHWLLDVDNVYGYGGTAGSGGENGPTAPGPCYINSYQRGSQESVWETIPQPSCETFTFGAGAAGGYLPLSLFGIAPIGGMGDETLTNFNVPAFKYGGEAYSSLAIDSNGYVIVGGGDANDNECCNMPDLPDPGKPNNTLAPFWTDLNPADAAAPAGSGIRIGDLTDGTNSWIVIDYNNVPLFGGAKLETFEIWIQEGDTEGLWYDFGPVADPGNLTGLVIGAENRDGTSGVTTYSDPEGGPVHGTIGTVPANNDEYAVVLTGPTAGGSVSIDYDATALKAGTYTETANLTSDVTPGITQITQQLIATKPPKKHGHH
jgi:hypothetical protein